MVGDGDRALDLLGRAVRAGFRKREWIEHDPDIDPLRGDPRYRAIMESL
jgi:hypothetical protein